MRKKLLGAFTVAFAVLWFLPVVWMLITSLKYETDIFQLPPIWIPSRITLDHYKVVMERSHILRWFLNSVVITTCVTFLVLIVDSLAAFAFARLRFFGRDVLFSIVLASMMVPGQVNHCAPLCPVL
jgi:multiple sugar transport system permease protein